VSNFKIQGEPNFPCPLSDVHATVQSIEEQSAYFTSVLLSNLIRFVFFPNC